MKSRYKFEIECRVPIAIVGEGDDEDKARAQATNAVVVRAALLAFITGATTDQILACVWEGSETAAELFHE